MKTIDLKQGSEEWLDWRLEHATASDAAVIMGCAPDYWQVRTWEELHLVKCGLGLPPDEFTQRLFEHGHRNEEVVRGRFAPGAQPCCVEMSADSRFAASLDGLREKDGRTEWLEVKSVTSARSKLLRHLEDFKTAPPYVFWQLVHQAACLEDENAVCRLIVYLEYDVWDGFRVEAGELLERWPELRARWERFLEGEMAA